MNFDDAFAQLDEPPVRPADQPGSRTAVQPGSRTAVQPPVQMERPAVLPGSRPAVQPTVRVERPAVLPTSRTAVQPGIREPGKRSDPSYEKVTMLLRKSTHKEVKARVVRIGEGDVSDLIERLLSEWLKGA